MTRNWQLHASLWRLLASDDTLLLAHSRIYASTHTPRIHTYSTRTPLHARYVDCPVTVGRAEDVYFTSVETNTTDALSSWLKLRGSDRFGSWQGVWEGMTRSRRVAALNPKMGITPMGSIDQSAYDSFPLSEKEKVIMDICVKHKRAGEQVVIATLFVECNVRLLAVCEKFGLLADRFDGKVSNNNCPQNCSANPPSLVFISAAHHLPHVLRDQFYIRLMY
jgi:hypothetical protein